MLDEHNNFKEKAKETREKVKLLLTLAETLVDKGHVHAQSIKKWVGEVDATYKDFSTRMDSYRGKLEKTLGIQVCHVCYGHQPIGNLLHELHFIRGS